MKLTFLGTSSGTPTKTRNVSGVVILPEGKHWFLVDCGEGTQHQLLYTSYSLDKLSAIFITHIHGDHCYGLPGLLGSASMAGRTSPLTIVGPKQIEEMIQAVIRSTELYLGFEINFLDVTAAEKVWNDGKTCVTRFPLSHRVPSYAYKFSYIEVENVLDTTRLHRDNIPRGPIWGAIQRGEEVSTPGGSQLKGSDYLMRTNYTRNLVVGGDNDTPSLLGKACLDVNVLVHEATYTAQVADKVGQSAQHSCAKRVATFAQQEKIPTLILTHFSARYQDNTARSPSIADIEHEARQVYKGDLYLAQDFDSYLLARDGMFKKL